MNTIDWLKVAPPQCLLPRRPAVMPRTPRPLTRNGLFDLVDQYRAVVIDRFRDREVALERGRTRCSYELDEVVSGAFANLRAPEPPRHLHARVEAVIAAICEVRFEAPAVPYWLACQGLGFAIRATCRWAPLALCHAWEDDSCMTWVVRRTRPAFDPMPPEPVSEGPWAELRRAVAFADPETYQEARVIAASVRDGAGPVVRCGLSFAFPSEPDWAREDAFHEVQCVPRSADEPVAEHLLMLLASLRDPVLAERIAREAVAHGSGERACEYAWEIVANLGARAEPVLAVLGAERAIERVRRAVPSSRRSNAPAA